MSPLAALTAILMGSAVAITTGLLMVLAVYGILGSDYPRLMAETPTLLRSLGLFCVLTAVSVAAFIGAVRYRPWRWYAQAGTYGWIAVIVWAYWPTRY
jgi:hypothetical protein